MKVFILQPPVTQLNTPYPSGAYLSSFFKKLMSQKSNNISSVCWTDINILLYESIFCREGLSKLFDLSKDNALKIAKDAQLNGRDEEAFQLLRYINKSNEWINWIDKIRAILSGSSIIDGRKVYGREFCQEFIFSSQAPRGSRMDSYLSSLERNPTDDDALSLATFALADIADYINVAFDKNFELVRYAEHLTASVSSFDTFLKELDSPILKHFLLPVIETYLQKICNSNEDNFIDKKYLFCISIPFPGCFVPAIFIAREIKEWSRKNNLSSIISIGGGYCSTELRETKEQRLSLFTDIMSYDRGYCCYSELISRIAKCKDIKEVLQKPLYDAKIFLDNQIINPLEINISNNNFVNLDNELTENTFPDYSDINFSCYPRLADDTNPMHRLWSCGSWLKAYLAHGCYWHRCAFCDTTLDYVCGYKKINTKKLFISLYEQAQKTGIYGIHFVDEASPPSSLREFALLNCKQKIHLTYWGNIRFEKTFSRDLTDILAYGGMTGVSGGIEIATGNGLESVNKGTDIDSIISALCAFKESGILVHAYMIFGFYNQSVQDLINSMETLRQLFANNLIDSSFFHKFVLTRHSTVYSEWKKGLHPELHPLSNKQNNDNPIFAMNDIRFLGEEKSQKYSQPLETAVNEWMHSNLLEKSVTSFFNFKVPYPTISNNFVQQKISLYEQLRNTQFDDYDEFINNFAQFTWLGGIPICVENTIVWNYMQDEYTVTTLKAEQIVEFLLAIRPEVFNGKDPSFNKSTITRNCYNALRGNGLCRVK